MAECGQGRISRRSPAAPFPASTIHGYDQVLDAAVTVGAVPNRFAEPVDAVGSLDLAGMFTLARGEGDRPALEMTVLARGLHAGRDAIRSELDAAPPPSKTVTTLSGCARGQHPALDEVTDVPRDSMSRDSLNEMSRAPRGTERQPSPAPAPRQMLAFAAPVEG
ncbi:hypothetical protein BH10ACT6_BH10ACT6_11210 [soil metagenome]